MKEYTFHMGGVDHELETYKGLFFSWMVNASSAEEAVAISKRELAPSSDSEALVIEEQWWQGGVKLSGMIVGVDPAAISAANIIEVWEEGK